MRHVYVFIFVVFLPLASFAQFRTYTFEDGTKIDVEIVSIDPDKAFRTSIYAGAFGLEVGNNLGISHYQPKKYFVSARLGILGGGVDGSFLFSNKLKRTKIKGSVRLSPDVKEDGLLRKYVLEIPIKKRRSYGVHVGWGYHNHDYFNAHNIAAGFTMLTAKQTYWRIPSLKNKRKAGSLVSRLNADVVFYVGRKLAASTINQSIEAESINDITRPVGARLYYDGWASAWGGSGKFTIHYMAGLALYSRKDALPIIFGFGLGYSFGQK